MELTYVPYAELKRIRNLDCTPIERTSLFATACRINTLYMITEAGSGHLGSSFSAMDIVSWLYLNELDLDGSGRGDGDLYFSSKGHDVPGLYSVLVGMGRLEFELIHKLRQIEGLPGHPDISTPGIVTNTGSLGMGISKAKGMVLAQRLKRIERNIYVLTGDGELQEGQIWESLPSAVHKEMGEITVIVDHNKIQSDTWVKNVNDLGDLESKFASFGWLVKRCSGHDYEAFARCIEECRGVSNKPKVVIADTIKGCGVSFMAHTAMTEEQELYRYHSGAPDDESYNRALEELLSSISEQLNKLGASKMTVEHRTKSYRSPPANPQRLVQAYSKSLVEQGAKHTELVVLDADLMLDCGLIPFRDRFPERFIECGIAEQDMVSTAGGLALQGTLPVVNSFSCFLSVRPNEQLYNNATENTKIIYVATMVGVLPGGPGHSHQSVRDISALGAVPGLIMVEPSCDQEVESIMDFSINDAATSVFVRLVNIPYEIEFTLPTDYKLEYGRGTILNHGTDAIAFAYGPVMVSEAMNAARRLKQDAGLEMSVVNLPWLNDIDEAWLYDIICDYKCVFTIDNHLLKGGQGEMIAAQCAEFGRRNKNHQVIHRFGLDQIPLCGPNDKVLDAHGLDGESMAGVMKSLIQA